MRIIMITGIMRSGTSLIGRAIEASGAYAGKVNKMCENAAVKHLIDRFYETNGWDPSGQKNLPDLQAISIPTNWRRRVLEALEVDEKERKVCMIKDNRLSQIWPVWNYAFPEAQWVIVRRRTGDIIQSCMKTTFMTGQEDEEGWKQWIRHHEECFVQMINEGLDCKIVWPHRMVTGDYQQVYEMLRWLGLDWSDKIVTEIDPLLTKSRLL